MTVERHQIHRTIGNHFVKNLFVRKARRLERRIGPTHARDPRSAGMRRRVNLHPFLNFGNRFCSVQIHLRQPEGSIHEVDVAIDKAWQNKALASIDHLGA